MSIHPAYAEAILDGRKRVEFRKRPMAPDIDTVLVYATAPVQRIVGEFTTTRSVAATPTELWEQASPAAGIAAADYFRYYAGSAMAVGIVIDSARRYDRPVSLPELTPTPATPQSFAYLGTGVLDAVRIAAGEQPAPRLPVPLPIRLAVSAFTALLRRSQTLAPVLSLPRSPAVRVEEPARRAHG